MCVYAFRKTDPCHPEHTSRFCTCLIPAALSKTFSTGGGAVATGATSWRHQWSIVVQDCLWWWFLMLIHTYCIYSLMFNWCLLLNGNANLTSSNHPSIHPPGLLLAQRLPRLPEFCLERPEFGQASFASTHGQGIQQPRSHRDPMVVLGQGSNTENTQRIHKEEKTRNLRLTLGSLAYVTI